MASSGYQINRFVNGGYEPFQCGICNKVVHEPFQCNGCGKLYCKGCFANQSKKSVYACMNSCTNSTISPIFSKALLRMYNNLDVKCSNPKCNSILKLIDLPKHQINCMSIKCWNFDNCEKPMNKDVKSGKPCCSEICNFLISVGEKISDKKAMYDLVGEYYKKVRTNVMIPSYKNIPVGNNQAVSNVNTGGQGSLGWDQVKTGGGIAITQNGASCFLKEQSYLFRSCLTKDGFNSGVHYWEIIADSRTQNELKIGVSTKANFDFNSAFCDHVFGFAYYGLGQLRNGSNASGSSYGKKFKKEGVLGVYLNMNAGTLSFSLNGENMGVAYTSDKLKQGPIFPAVALLHCAGCKIRAGLPIPSIFK